MKKQIQIAVLLVFITINAIAQQGVLTKKDLAYNYLFKEKIFLYQNASILLVGDNLLYSVYCMNDRYDKFSTYSKIVYIELISPDKELIFKHKVKLKDGMANGYYFIPTNLNSGNYKLIAYTQAMRNEASNYFFKSDLGIVNPYQRLDSSRVLIDDSFNDTNDEDYSRGGITITSPIKNFKTREKVELIFKNRHPDKKAYMSIGVKKLDELSRSKNSSADNYDSLYPQTTVKIIKGEDLKYLPEVKGQLLSGKVVSNKKNVSHEKIPVILSIPDKEFNLRYGITDKAGEFIFNLDAEVSSSKSLIQVLNQDQNNFKIEMDTVLPIDYRKINFNKLVLSSKYKDVILEYSIYNQIENAYKSGKRDSLKEKEKDYLDNYKTEYVKEVIQLDDFKRFETLKETIVEIVPNAWITRKSGKEYIKIRKLDPYKFEEYLPLVLVDGLLTQNYERIINFDAKKVKSITLIRNDFRFGNTTFQGIMNIATFDDDYHSDGNEENGVYFNVINTLPEKEYFKQIYDENDTYDRVPDFRTQLYWDPKIELKTEQKILNFYTSDIKGVFQIQLEGFYEDGTPISIRKSFKVN